MNIQALIAQTLERRAAMRRRDYRHERCFSAHDAGAYLRARFVLVHDAAANTPDFEAFGREITRQLRGISRGYPIEPRSLHYLIATFADHCQINLNPLVRIAG